MRASGLSSATVSNVISDLVSDGLVEGAGSVDSDGGRPRTLLQVRPGYGQVIGVDVGETHLQVGLFDTALSTIATSTYPIAETHLDPDLVARLVFAGIDEVTSKAGVDAAGVLGVGVGVPGAVQADGLVHAPTLSWSGVPFAAMLRPGVAAPLYIDNCARTLGQAEMWRGAGRGAERAIIALLGVGLGAAMTTGSDSYSGATSTTSEWGHTVIQVGGLPCRCGSRGCLEAYVGAEAVLQRYRELPGAKPFGTSGTESQLAELVTRAAEPGAAAEALDVTAEYLGIGIANLINLLSPDRVILSGWAGATLGATILPAVRDAARRHALGYMYGHTLIELGQLGQEAVALGAATLPIVELLTTTGRRKAF